MRHVVLIQANNVAKFNYCKFGNYKNTKGKNIVLIKYIKKSKNDEKNINI